MRKNPTLIMVLTFVLIAVVVIFIRSGQTQPRLTWLLAEGQYQMSDALLESGILLVDEHIANINEYGHTFSFGTHDSYRYFKITVFHEAAAAPLHVILSNGDRFFTGRPDGTTQIIYTAWPWSDGEHYVTLEAGGGRVTNTHIQVLVTDSLEAITEGLLSPRTSQVITMTYAERAFEITNHSPYHMRQSMNYSLERETRPHTWEQTGHLGLFSLDIPPGGSQLHVSDIQDTTGVNYRIRVHRFYMHWTNENGVALQQPFDLFVELRDD